MIALITGSNGLLGQKIIEQLNSKDNKIIATSKGSNRNSKKTGFVLEKAKKHLNYHPKSFSDSLQYIDKQLTNQNN